METLKAVLRRVRRVVRAAEERRWLHENREAISYYNRRVAEYGLLADDTGSCSAGDAIEKLTP